MPSTCGSGRRTTTTPPTRAATRASTTSTTPYADPRTHPGQSDSGGVEGHVRHCAVALAVDDGECQPLARATPEDTLPTYQYSCTECGHFFETVQSFSDDSLTRLPRVRGPAAQGLQRGRRRLQGLRLLPQRQPRQGRREQQRSSRARTARARTARAPATKESSKSDSSSRLDQLDQGELVLLGLDALSRSLTR